MTGMCPTIIATSAASSPQPTRLRLASSRWSFCANKEDRELLEKLSEEPIEHIHHELFDKANAERVLFGRSAELAPNKVYFDELEAYKETAGKETRLTSSEEILLFQRYNYARMIVAGILDSCEGNAMPPDGGRLLVAWAHRMIGLRDLIVQLNMPLVLAMAKRTRLSGLDNNELISEGNLALLRSADKFDCSRGFKFSTYACRAILKSFSRVAMRTARYRGRFPAEFDPTLEKSDFVDRKREDIEMQSVEEVRDIISENRAALNDVEQTVIRERFALNAATLPAKGKTLEQVGEMIGVTKERVRQIQNKALAKIRVIMQDSYT